MKRTLYHIATIAVLLLTSALGAQTAGLSVMDPFAATRPVVGTGNLPLPAPLYYTPAELTVQYLQNRACAREYVLSYDPVPDSLEYPEDNYQLPVSRRSVDNEPITPFTWQWVHLELPYGSEDTLTAHLRRPNWWLEEYGAAVPGAWGQLYLPEMNISGYAEVKGIYPSRIDTRIATFAGEGPYRYRPITGWFERKSPAVWDAVFSSGDTIAATPNHPFYSFDRQLYLPLEELRIGERVQLVAEQTATLPVKQPRAPGAEKVYNLEVWRDHNYHVGDGGVLVHNECARTTLGKFLYDQLIKDPRDEYDYTINAAKEFLEDMVSSGIGEFSVGLGESIAKDVAYQIRKTAREFAFQLTLDFSNKLLTYGVSTFGQVQELEMEVKTQSGTYTIVADQVIVDPQGNIHIGEAKYSTFDQDWINIGLAHQPQTRKCFMRT